MGVNKYLCSLSLFLGLLIGCTPVRFQLDDSICKNNNCIIEDGKYSYKYTVTSGSGKVDILFIIDNSASMSFEQNKLAPRLQTFIYNLDLKKIDYRIGISTTDISDGPFSTKNRLTQYSDSSYFITPTSTDRYTLFSSNITRPETIKCENFIADYFKNHDLSSKESSEFKLAYQEACPSGDERGIYAANLIIENNPNDFIRKDAHLSIIFITDEDERSGLYNSKIYPLDKWDQPNSLIENIKEKFGSEKFNSLSVHSVIIKDSKCLEIQNNQILGVVENPITKGLMPGSIGNAYLKFNEGSWGIAADICSDNYTEQIGQIQTRLENQIKEILLKCSNPSDLAVSIGSKQVESRMEGKVLKLGAKIQPGSQIELSYKCSAD